MLKLGTRVITRFADQRKGSVLDFWFELADEGANSKASRADTVVGYE
jgi:hypothetical protein